MTGVTMQSGMERAAALELSFINKRLQKGGRSADDASRSVEEYRKFIAILADAPDKIYVPTKLADPAWHEHILFMKQYEEDMARVVGGKVYHTPEVVDCPIWYEGITNTQEAFRSMFGIELEQNDFAICYINVVAID